MVRIKICGITNPEDARLASELGANALGFIFHAASPRRVAPEAAREIIRRLPPLVLSVGVFVDEEAAVVRELAALGGPRLGPAPWPGIAGVLREPGATGAQGIQDRK